MLLHASNKVYVCRVPGNVAGPGEHRNKRERRQTKYRWSVALKGIKVGWTDSNLSVAVVCRSLDKVRFKLSSEWQNQPSKYQGASILLKGSLKANGLNQLGSYSTDSKFWTILEVESIRLANGVGVEFVRERTFKDNFRFLTWEIVEVAVPLQDVKIGKNRSEGGKSSVMVWSC